MPGALDGKVAVVTGAGRGIGRAEAMAFAKHGAAVVVNDLGVNPDGTGGTGGPAEEVVAEIQAAGGRAVANFDNVGQMQGAQNIIDTALKHFGRLDILLNNAGFLRDKMFWNMSEEDFDALINVHLKGTFATCRAAAPIFREQRSGRIINTSAGAGLGNMGQANYSAAKEGIIGLTRTLALDLGKYGVTANALRPGAGTRLTMSAQLMAAAEKLAKSGDTRLYEGLKNKAKEKPELVTPFIVWLCTDAAAHINGYDFRVTPTRISLYSQPEEIRIVHPSSGTFSFGELAETLPAIFGDLKNKSALAGQ